MNKNAEHVSNCIWCYSPIPLCNFEGDILRRYGETTCCFKNMSVDRIYRRSWFYTIISNNILFYKLCPIPFNKYEKVKHGCPRRQQSRITAKISKSYILTPPHPQGHVMSVKCEEPIDELTVLYHNPNFKYCTLFVSGTELRTDRQTDRQTDGRSDY